MAQDQFFEQFKPADDQFYDYDAAIKSGAKPDKSGHWPSDFKKPGHPNEIVGGFNTRTGMPEKGHQLITNPDELMKMGWDSKTALELSRKYGNNSNEPDDFFDQFSSVDEPTNESTIKPVNENESDTWMKGFINSITSGDAPMAGLKGAYGFAKGATLDIPASIYGGLKSVYNLATNPVETISNIPSDIRDMVSGIGERFSRAGSEPEEFGRMMGNITGQPAVTAGITSGIPKGTFGSSVRIPSGINVTGAVTEGAGKLLQNYPVTGWVPRWTLPQNIRRLDANVVSGGIGRGLEYVGQKMRGFGKPPLQGELVSEDMPTIQDGEIITPRMKELPPSNVDFYGVERNPNPIITPSPRERLQLPKSKVFHYGEQGLQEGEALPKYKVIRNESPSTSTIPKRKVRPNGDGTFTDLNTGELLDSKGQSIIEYGGKPIDRNSPFFTRNR